MHTFSRKLISVLTGLALTGLATTVATGPSFAADMLEGEGVDFTQVEFGTGWYLRGEIGATAEEPSTVLIANGQVTSGESSYGNAVSFGVGGGFSFGNGLRAELGLNHTSGFTYSDTSGNYACGTYNVGGLDIVDNGACRTDRSAHVSSTTVGLSAFIDGPEFLGLTPYAGVGAGISVVSWNDRKTQIVCSGLSSTDCRGNGIGAHLLQELEAAETTSYAPTYSLMLGAAYNLNQNTKLDVGYRYSTTAGTTIVQAANNTFLSRDEKTGDIDVHEIRVGVRYEIW